MPNFSYKALDKSGKMITDIEDAKTKQELFATLKKNGFTPVSATETKAKKQDNTKTKPATDGQGFFSKLSEMNFQELSQMDVIPQPITSKDYSVLCRQAYTMLNAGMNIISTLQVLSVQIENKRLKQTIAKVLVDLQKGYPFSTCLRIYPKVFPTLFINMIEAGELTGNLDGVFNSLAEYYERESEINGRVKKATVYPKVVGVVAVVVVMLLLIFVVPTFVTMFEDSGTELPKMTQNLINMSDFVQKYWYAVFGVIFLLSFAIGQIKKHEKSKYYYDLIANKLPVVGNATVKISTARFSRTSATLLQSGIPIIAAIKSSAQVSDNSLIIKGIDDVTDEIRAGQSLSLMLAKINYFPPMMISMVSIGEESGDIVGLLDKTADYYENEMREAVDTLTGLIEPIMIVFLASVVGYVVMAILLPVLDMAQTVQ